MAKEDRPGAVRLLIYVIVAAGLSGGLSGWITASGAQDWAAHLSLPVWAEAMGVMNIIALVVPQFIVLSLWICQRSGRDGWRLLCSLAIVILLAGLVFRVAILFGGRDVTMGFLATLGLWIYALFTVFFVQRACKPAGILLWVPFGWITFSLVLNFEMMRLNTGTIGGL